MQALAANRHFMEALDLQPVVMIRALPDMLASYLDELEDQPLRPDKWLNIKVPDAYPGFSDEQKGDFVIEMMVPWYVSFFSTWLDYARTDARVLFLHYDDFRADPAGVLEKLLAHSRLPRSREHCQAALDEVWEERTIFRYNKGVSGRGRARFTPGTDRAHAPDDRLLCRSGAAGRPAYSAALSFLGAGVLFSSGLRYWPV